MFLATNLTHRLHSALARAHDLIADWSAAYKLRAKRRLLLWRAFRKRKQLSMVEIRTAGVGPNNILLFATVRNSQLRLPFFMAHYRRLGVQHFFFISNNSTDGTNNFLARQQDVSIWTTSHSYKLSRLGMDWVTWQQIKYAHQHWCLTLDADEIFIYPFYETRPLRALTNWLDTQEIASFGALMLDLYSKERLETDIYTSGQNTFEILNWFERVNYFIKRQLKLQNLWIQGGIRARCFLPTRRPSVRCHWSSGIVASVISVRPTLCCHGVSTMCMTRPVARNCLGYCCIQNFCISLYRAPPKKNSDVSILKILTSTKPITTV